MSRSIVSPPPSADQRQATESDFAQWRPGLSFDEIHYIFAILNGKWIVCNRPPILDQGILGCLVNSVFGRHFIIFMGLSSHRQW